MHNYKNIYVTIKVTLKCNLACKYCYGRDNHAIGTEMSEDEVLTAVRFVHDYTLKVKAKSLTLCWHGGEPFLLSHKLPLYMDYVNKLFEESGIKVTHATQTNATLLFPSTFDTIKKYFNGHIGVSIDLFSNFRTLPNGRVSTEIAIKNVDRALASGVRCSVINLITKQNLNHIADIYEFYKKRHMNVRLAKVFPINPKEDLSSPIYITDEEFGNAQIEYFNLWASDPAPAYNSDIVSLITDLLLGVPSLCLREKACHQRYLALSPGGEIFSCAEFDVPEASIGNFLNQTPTDFIQSNEREKLAAKAPIPTQCNSCPFLRTCHGGCFRERFMIGYPYRCKSNIIYWNHIVEWLNSKGTSLYALYGKSLEEKHLIINKVFGGRS